MARRHAYFALKYVLATLAVALATVLNLTFRRWIGSTETALLLTAVMAAAWVGGLGPGLFAAVLATLSLNGLFFGPDSGISFAFTDIVRCLFFLITAAFIHSLVEARRRAELAEHGQRLWYRGLLTSVGDGVIGTDHGGNVAFINTTAEELTGWPAADAMGRPVDEVLTIRNEMVGVPVLGPAERAMRVGKAVGLGPIHSVLLVDRSGRRFSIDGLAAPIRTPDGLAAGVVFVFRDVTANRRSAEVVAELAAIVASSQDAIIVRGTDDRITSWNPGAEVLFGYPAGEVIGQPMAMLAPVDRTDELPLMLTRIENGLPISHFETQQLRKDGRRIDVSISVSPLKDGDGRIIGASTIARDVTERRQGERRLAVQYAVSRILSESATLGLAIPRLIEAIGSGLQWELGIAWEIDGPANRLRYQSVWHRGGVDLQRFAEANKSKTFVRGEGLPGNVWADGEPVWIAVIAESLIFTRGAIASDADLGAAVSFAIRSGADVLGVVEFFSRDQLTPDEPMLAMLAMLRVIGIEIGQFVERKRAEADLRIAEGRFRALANSGNFGIAVVDLDDGHLVEANDTYLALIGANRDDFDAGRVDPRAMTSPEHRDLDDRACKAVQSTGVCEPYVKEYFLPDGRVVSVLIGAAKLVEESPRAITFLIDVTERRRAERALSHREEQLRLALDVAGMGTWDWKLATNETEWSDNLEAVHGAAPGTFNGETDRFYSVLHPDDLVLLKTAMERAYACEIEFNREFRVRATNGTIRWINCRGRVFRDDEGRAVRMIGVNLNITEQKQAQQDLQDAKEVAVAANLAKNQFLAVLSHELRTPLTPVLAAVTAMLEDPTTPADYGGVLQMIRRNVELEARLIDDLLDVTRISQGKLRLETEVVDAHELLYQALDICVGEIRSKGIEFRIGLDAPAHHVKADPARLQQVFWNLIKNAVKFTPAGGRLSIEAHNDERGRLVVRVVDTGRGIESEALPKIFNAFEQGDAAITQRFGGLGLGLAISRSVIDALGGRLTAESEGRDKGATFTIELATVPAPTNAARTEGDGPRDQVAKAGPFRILLVEDNEDSLKILTRLLRHKGHTVTTANSVATASAVAPEEFDVLVSDLGLPDGSGFDVIRLVRERSDVPAIALSGYGMESDLRNTREAGFDAHLIKPIDIQQLETTLQTVMARHCNPPLPR